MLKHTRPKVSASSVVVSLSNAVCVWVDCPYFSRSIVLPEPDDVCSLLDPKHFLLPFLGSRFPLEAAVGMNGRIWISAKEVKQTVAVIRCIEAVEGGMDEGGVKKLFGRLEI